MEPILRKTYHPSILITPLLIVTLLLVFTSTQAIYLTTASFLTIPNLVSIFFFLSTYLLWYRIQKGGPDRYNIGVNLMIILVVVSLYLSIIMTHSGCPMSITKTLFVIPVIMAAMLFRSPILLFAHLILVTFLINRPDTLVSNTPGGYYIFEDLSFAVLLTALAVMIATLSNCDRRSKWSKLLDQFSFNPLLPLDSRELWDYMNVPTLKKSSIETLSVLRALLIALEERDQYSIGHCVRVMFIAGRIAEVFDLPTCDQSMIRAAGLFHDIGKIEINHALLNKTEPLNLRDIQAIRQHPELSVGILKKFNTFPELHPAILHHHEWFNGKGYPCGLKGKAIPIGARIIAVADSIDAMASHRPYESPMTCAEIIKELEVMEGTQFDPSVVQIAFQAVCRDPIWNSLGYQT